MNVRTPLTMLGAGVIALGLAACGGSAGSSEATPTTESLQTTTEAPDATVATKAVPGGGCNTEGAERPYGKDQVLHCDGTRWEVIDTGPSEMPLPVPYIGGRCAQNGETTEIMGQPAKCNGQVWEAAPTPTTTTPPLAQPMVYDGSGSTVLDLGATLTEPKILVASNDGGSNFIINAKSETLEDQGALYVNEIGPTSGTYLLNLHDSDRSRFLEIDAEGNWHVEILDLRAARPWQGTVSGVGSDVVVYTGQPGLLDYLCVGDSNCIMTDALDSDLYVNEIGPISGTTTIAQGPMLIEVNADGDWSMNVRPV
jgi:hypothetical protein